MCGIFTYSGIESEAGEQIFEGLKALEYRGYDSWGIAVLDKIDDGEIDIQKNVGKIGNSQLDVLSSEVGIGHTRWATHGGVTRDNAHPHSDCADTLTVIHNGIIENFETLKSNLKPGHIFKSQTDTEVVAHLLEELCRDLDFTQAVRQAFLMLDGMNAIVALDAESRRIVAAKKGSPLVLGVSPTAIYLASDASAILPHTRQLIFIEDGWLVEIAGTTYHILNAETNQPIKVIPQHVDWAIEQATLNQFDHFMLKEIHEQPKVLRHLATHAQEKVGPLASLIQPSFGTFMIGCGTASYAALSGTYLFSRIPQRHVNFVVASEFFYQEQYLTPDSLILAISQSGETMDIIESINLAKKHQAKVAAITNTLGSTLYRQAEAKVLLDAGLEKSVCSTKAFTAMVGVLLLLAYQLADNLNQGQKLLTQAADDIEAMLQPKRLDQFKQIAEYIKKFDHAFLIGRGLSYATALEAALKVKEVSYIHAEGFAGGELKHGVIALIEPGTPCLVFAPPDETEAAIISNAMELKARGAHIIGIGPTQHSAFDDWIPAANVGDASIISNVIPAQLLAYYLAVAKGYDPDKPRNLAKSVTVR